MPADEEFVSRLEFEVAEVIRLHGPPRKPALCVVEIHKFLPHHPIDSITPRPAQLVRKGIIRLLGKKPRANRYGRTRMQNVYEYIYSTK